MVKFYKASEKAHEILDNLRREEGFPIGESFDTDSNGTAATRLALIDQVLETAPKKTIEIGAGPEGYSTICIIAALTTLPKEAREFFTIDIETKKIGVCSIPYAIRHFRKYRQCFGTTSIESHEKLGNNINLLTIDGSHRYPWPMLDFLACLPHMAPGARVFFHDFFSPRLDFGSVNTFIASVIAWRHVTDVTFVMPSVGRDGYGIEAAIVQLDDTPFTEKETVSLVANLLGEEYLLPGAKYLLYPQQQRAVATLLREYYEKDATAKQFSEYVLTHVPMFLHTTN